jgi:Bacterial EndoU nuclease/PA14 domain
MIQNITKAIISQSQTTLKSVASLTATIYTKSFATLLLTAQLVTILALSATLIQYKPLTDGVEAEAAFQKFQAYNSAPDYEQKINKMYKSLGIDTSKPNFTEIPENIEIIKKAYKQTGEPVENQFGTLSTPNNLGLDIQSANPNIIPDKGEVNNGLIDGNSAANKQVLEKAASKLKLQNTNSNTQPATGTGLIQKPEKISAISSSSAISNFTTKSGKSIKMKSYKVKNLDGTESVKLEPENPSDQTELNKETLEANPLGEIKSNEADKIAKPLTESEMATATAKTNEESAKNQANEDTRAFSTNSKGEKSELKEVGKDQAAVDARTKETGNALKSQSTNKFVTEISNEDSKTKGQKAIVAEFSEDESSNVDKNFVGAVTDETLMSKAGLERRKKLLKNKPTSTYKLQGWGNNCDFNEYYNQFCSEYYNGINRNGDPQAKGIDGWGPNMYSDWGWENSPSWGKINRTNWSSRSRGHFWLEPGVYEVATTADDGISVWVNGTNYINNYQYQGRTNRYNRMTITYPQYYDMEVLYFQGGGSAIRGTWINRLPDDANPIVNMRTNNDTRVSGNNFVVTADAWDPGTTPTGIKRVEFFAWYDGSWKYVGQESNDFRDNIYSVGFNIPANTNSQTVYIQANVYDYSGRGTPSGWAQLNYYKRTAEKCNMPANQWCGNYFNSTDGNYFNNPDGILRNSGWSWTDPNNNPSGQPTSQGFGLNYGYGAINDIRSDNFQARTHGQFYFPRGYYKFNSTSDDTATIWIADAYYGYGNYGNARQILIGNGTSNEVLLEGNKIVIVDYKEFGGLALQQIKWERTRIDDDKDPNGKITSIQWGINNNPRCFRVWSQAWDEGNSQSGVNYVNFYAAYAGSWKYLGYEYNDGDNIYTQTHCLPDNIPSGTNVEVSIHIADKSGRYRYNGSEGNKYSTFTQTDNVAPNGRITKQFILPKMADFFFNYVDMTGEFEDNSGGVGIKQVDYYYIKNIANKTSFSSNEFIKGCTATIKTGTNNYDCRVNLPMADPDQIIGFFAIAYDNNLNQRFVGGTYKEDGQAQLVNMEYWGNPVLWGGRQGLIAGVALISSGFASGTVSVWTSINGAFQTYGSFQCTELIFGTVNQETYIDCGLTIAPVGTIIKKGSEYFKIEQLFERGGKFYSRIVKTFAPKVIQSLPSLNNVTNFNSTGLVHTLEGAIGNSGAVGFHHVDSSIGRIVGSKLRTTNVNGNEIYEAVVEVKNSAGVWIAKTGNNGKSTFFPDNWTRQQVVNAINEAYTNKSIVSGNTYGATISNGMRIEMFIQNVNGVDKIISAFPVI